MDRKEIVKAIQADEKKQKLLKFLASMDKDQRRIWVDLYLNGRIAVCEPLPKNIRVHDSDLTEAEEIGRMNTTPIRRLGGKFYYVIGIPLLCNMTTGNFSGDHVLLKNPEHDFFFITYKKTGYAVKGYTVPKKVVLENAQMKRNKKTKYPVFVISMDIVKNWKTDPRYKDLTA